MKPGYFKHLDRLEDLKDTNYEANIWSVETIQDFLIKLGIEPRMHILEIPYFLI